MEGSAPGGFGHVVIVGAPEGVAESLVIVVGEERAVPLFSSTAEAREFLDSLTGLDEGWFPAEIPPDNLLEMLRVQPGEVRYVALSPPPEDLEGGMEFRLLEIESLCAVLDMQVARSERTTPAEKVEAPERKGLLRRLLGR
ncbi:Hypothetical Protein RradSPS_0107 [Rubrobacter radiotolerans]|uniref:SseB protein N-terminal domain-containing protein n=1 Tax=Rubrobacter radiotolerans TaxID=42256 RepID=A0A023X042_RUBRA|nr:hypothetical protein [Rubrobacter radiotolerans]AHY45390.1 Hypothetical Protein RradSPS_0107 [Rubrobacter radiotolerans]MDX5892801.1 hypothetical protein [Rubrobacter radiotolerans]SMC02521.1 conserved hypothetical protein [Rubrobacter radiotolerans DSM 5868]